MSTVIESKLENKPEKERPKTLLTKQVMENTGIKSCTDFKITIRDSGKSKETSVL